MLRQHKKIGEILVDLEVMQEEDIGRVLDALARRQGRQKFGQMARDMGLVREEHILAALAVQMELLPRIHELSLWEILRQLAADSPSN